MTWLSGLLALVRRYPLQAVIVVLLGVLAVTRLQLQGARADKRRLGIEKVSLEAQLDSGRALRAKEVTALIAMYGRDVHGWRRLVEQGKLERTALDKELGLERTVSGTLRLDLKGLDAQITTGPVTSDPEDNVRTAPFDTTVGRYHAKGKMDVPRAPQRASLQLGITQAAIDLGIELGCHEKNSDGIRPASVVLLAPADVTARASRIKQSADVCNPAAQAKSGWKVPAWVVPVAAVAGALGKAVLFPTKAKTP